MAFNYKIANKILTAFMVLLVPSVLFALPYQGQTVLIAAPSPIAAEVGEEIYKSGGNVFDAAVAVALTLSVTSPYFASLGGGGFAMIKKTGEKVTALDFRETAPDNTNEAYFQKLKSDSSWTGGPAVGVPGIPAGLYEIHKRYGKLKWERLFKTPLKIARSGFQVSGEWFNYTRRESRRFNISGKKFFLKKDGQFYKPGDTLAQPQLVPALTMFRDRKLKGFYEGSVAKDIVQSVVKAGGVISTDDLKNYKVIWRTPLTKTIGDQTVHLMPPPSSGGVIIKTALELVERKNLRKHQFLSANETHLLGEVLEKSFRSRSMLGDPEFSKLPTNFLLSDKYFKKLAQSIRLSSSKKIKPLSGKDIPKESTETTHFVVMDSKGEAVSMTITLNGNYGSGVVSDRYGIALNNEMDDFTTKPKEPNKYGLIQGAANLVKSGKRPLSSMSPTIVTEGDKAVFAVGAPGGPRIISGVFQALYRVMFNKFNIEDAIMAPRVHHQFMPDKLYIEKNRFSPNVIQALRKKGQQIKYINNVAKVCGVRVNKDGLLEGYTDYRGEAAVSGF